MGKWVSPSYSVFEIFILQRGPVTSPDSLEGPFGALEAFASVYSSIGALCEGNDTINARQVSVGLISGRPNNFPEGPKTHKNQPGDGAATTPIFRAGYASQRLLNDDLFCALFLLLHFVHVYFRGMNRDEWVAPIPGRPCLTGLYVMLNSPR